MLVTKSVFKLIFVLSNYQLCTFPLWRKKETSRRQYKKETSRRQYKKETSRRQYIDMVLKSIYTEPLLCTKIDFTPTE